MVPIVVLIGIVHGSLVDVALLLPHCIFHRLDASLAVHDGSFVWGGSTEGSSGAVVSEMTKFQPMTFPNAFVGFCRCLRFLYNIAGPGKGSFGESNKGEKFPWHFTCTSLYKAMIESLDS